MAPKIIYDPTSETITYEDGSDKEVVQTEQIQEDILLDKDADGTIIRIEISDIPLLEIFVDPFRG